MNHSYEQLFLERKSEVDTIVGHVSVEKKDLEQRVLNPDKTFAALKGDEREKFHYFFGQWTLRLHNAKFSEKSPFFVRLVVKFDDKAEDELLYIGKFSFLDDKIYSWTVPVASLRFAPVGAFSYVRPNGQKRSGVVISREDYFIANGKIVSLYDITHEGRELIYDEHISARKTGFGLSDIVRELERAQNEIIILDPKGLMVISGPAGSGKTTLALHRVAYLLQNPDMSEVYKPENSLVLIQDESSVSYFSSLFVNLGVEGVRFTTFETWCSSLISLPNEYEYVDRFGDDALLRDWYEWSKVRVINEMPADLKQQKDIWKTLELLYHGQNGEFQKLWNEQQQKKVLDKQDLTALLKLQVRADNGRVLQQKRTFKKKAGIMVPVNVRVELTYDILLVDEFENYTADQLQILNKTANSKTSMLFVGDIHQQTKFGSVSDFSQTEVTVLQDRNIILSKVYRNSPSVINLLQSLGFGILSGTENEIRGSGSWTVGDDDTYCQTILDCLESSEDEQLGVVCYDESLVESVRKKFSKFSERIHIGTVMEFQGLEFDTVFVLGVSRSLFNSTGLDGDFDRERAIILRERLYVAITRARQNVTVFSDSEKSDIVLYLNH